MLANCTATDVVGRVAKNFTQVNGKGEVKCSEEDKRGRESMQWTPGEETMQFQPTHLNGKH